MSLSFECSFDAQIIEFFVVRTGKGGRIVEIKKQAGMAGLGGRA